MSRLVNASLTIAAVSLAAGAVAILRLGVRWDDGWLFWILVVLPALLALAASLALLAGSAAVRTNMVLGGAALLVGLYMANTLAALLPDPQQGTRPVLADRRSRPAVTIDLRENGTHAFMTVPAGILRREAETGSITIPSGDKRIVPLSNLSNQILVHCNEHGTTSVFPSDEQGFNNPPGSWNMRAEVALVGDSFVHGACVGPMETWAAVIRQQIPAAVSVALDDFGPLSQLAVIKEYLPLIRPREVFWVYYEGNDLIDLSSERESPTLRRYLESDSLQGLPAARARIDSAMTAYVERVLAEQNFVIPRPERRPVSGFDAILAGAGWWLKLGPLRKTLALDNLRVRLYECCDIALFKNTIVEANRAVSSWGGRLHFVYLPAALRYYRPTSAIADDAMRRRRAILRMAANLGLPVLDLHHAFVQSGDARSLFTHFRSHLNVKGYRLAALAVLQHLSEERYR